MTIFRVQRGFATFYTRNFDEARQMFHVYKNKWFLWYWGRTTIWCNHQDGYGEWECILASKKSFWEKVKERIG